jgi:hypothetical protein
MRFGIAFFAAFAIALAVTNHFSPFFPVQASPVEQFGQCLAHPQGSDARAQCINEHFAAMDKYTGPAMNQLGAGVLASFDLGNQHRR